ncbi:SinI family restriction endonuclease [Tumidithrix helvetica]|uniref:SinI family restriction endonuclease n=1 Tax=Tumidithrix helvetica TaxID=3457545 RepID=UPI003CC5C78C
MRNLILTFNIALARQVASTYCNNKNSENGLVESFSLICNFLADNPDRISWRGKNIPSVDTENGLKIFTERYFSWKHLSLVLSINA